MVMPTVIGNSVKILVYNLDVNPGRGRREWRLVTTFSGGPVDDQIAGGLGAYLDRLSSKESADRYTQRTLERAFSGAKTTALGISIVALNAFPGGATADAIDRGDYVDATISFVGDVVLLGAAQLKRAANAAKLAGGADAARKLGQIQKTAVRFAAVEGVIAVTRVGQAGYAFMQDERGQAAAYLGEAILRIFGVKYTRTVGSANTTDPRGFAKATNPPADVVRFATEFEGPLNRAVANRMRKLGVPDDMIGIKGIRHVDESPFNISQLPQGGANVNPLDPRFAKGLKPGINVDMGALDVNLPGMRNVPSWKSAPLKDRIDAVIAHEYTEALAKPRRRMTLHEQAVK
ncbi:MAG: hypothetical protein MI757_19875, partial [Pirellulales bacterium]|nr:hypothetical protein [Pirellulales bacterium]